MSYIKQKNANVYVVTDLEDLSQHPSLTTDLFEIVEGDPPEEFDRLIYSENES